jgi:prepilin-type N-terminal cleavage/methylation domain-containing protein
MIGVDKAMTALLGNRLTAQKGFSLMELLVVLGIFSTVVASATDIFMMASRAQRKVFALERTQADARFSMEAVAREVRTGAIDYDYYGDGLSGTGAVDVLALIDSAGKRLRFYKSSEAANCADAASTPCLMVTIDGGGTAPLTPKGVKVFNIAFFISPSSDPGFFDTTTASYPVNIQPRVTMTLVMESAAQDPRERSIVYLQTTVTNRGYTR